MKYTLQEARAILGVTKDSSKEEIEKRYDVILKKHRILKQEGNLDESAEYTFQKCTDAYRIIMGYEVDEPKVERKETYTDKAFQKVGIDRKKADNFFHYHKFHILIGIIAVIVIAFTIRSFVTRVEPDITIGMLGIVNQQAVDGFENKIKENVPEIKEISVDSAMLSGDSNDPQAYAYMQKAMVLIAASDTDLFLVNKYAYDSYATNGAFMDMGGIAKDLDIDVSKSDYLKLRVVDEWEEPKDMNSERKPKTYKDTEPQLYGIDVTNSEFFKGLDVVGPEKILVIRAGAENLDLILKLVKLFAK